MAGAIEKKDAIMMLCTGQQKVGKTHQTKILLNEYAKSDPKIGRKGRKALILDSNMEYTEYKTLHPDDVVKYTKQKISEIRRVLPKNNDGTLCEPDETIEILKLILRTYAKGCLVLEDINAYLTDVQKEKEVIGKIIKLRHIEVDVIIHYQSLAAVPPRMWQNASVIRFHKQQDTIDRYKSRIPYYEQLKIAEYLVDDKYFSGDIRFFCYVSGSSGYIRGKFEKKDIELACRKYAERNHPSTSSIAKSYKGKDAYKKAVDEVTKELVIKYYK